MSKKITAIIVGAGHRSMLYSRYALDPPDDFEVVGVADPDPLRRSKAAAAFGIPADRCFESAEELAKQPKLADAVINGTMDNQHVATAIPLLRRGYDMLLEKPFAVNEAEMWGAFPYRGGNRTHRDDLPRPAVCAFLCGNQERAHFR